MLQINDIGQYLRGINNLPTIVTLEERCCVYNKARSRSVGGCYTLPAMVTLEERCWNGTLHTARGAHLAHYESHNIV